MKILMVSLASSFTESMSYQENILLDQIQKNGNEAIIITTCYKYEKGEKITTPEEDKLLCNGARLIRKKYINIIGSLITEKVRLVKQLYQLIEDIQPDVVFCHGLQTYEMLTIKKYIILHPEVKFFVDSHEDFNNSATNFLSKQILHKIFYKKIIQCTLPYINKIFCVGYECFAFLKKCTIYRKV